jgi:hypothetical protein
MLQAAQFLRLQATNQFMFGLGTRHRTTVDQTSSGIATLVASEGYLINDLNNAIMPGYYGRIELWSNASLVLSRAGDFANADDGYFVSVYYTKTADSAGTE